MDRGDDVEEELWGVQRGWILDGRLKRNPRGLMGQDPEEETGKDPGESVDERS